MLSRDDMVFHVRGMAAQPVGESRHGFQRVKLIFIARDVKDGRADSLVFTLLLPIPRHPAANSDHSTDFLGMCSYKSIVEADRL